MRPEGRGMFRDAAKRPDTQAGEPQRKQWLCKYARVQSYTLNGKTPKREPQRSHRATNCKRPKKRTFEKIRRVTGETWRRLAADVQTETEPPAATETPQRATETAKAFRGTFYRKRRKVAKWRL